MDLINIDQFDTTTFNGIKGRLRAGILNARIVAGNDAYPKDWQEKAKRTLELAQRQGLSALEPFRYQDGFILTVQNGEICNVFFDNGEYHVRVQQV